MENNQEPELTEEHGTYVVFRYGPMYSFMATRGAGKRKWSLARSVINEDDALVLAWIADYETLAEAKVGATHFLTRLLVARGIINASGH